MLKPSIAENPKEVDRVKEPLESAWQALRLIGVYRLVLAIIFIFSYIVLPDRVLLGRDNPVVYFTVVNTYLVYAVFSLISTHVRKPDFNRQVYVHSLVDIFVITVCMHTSGGIGSGLGMLLVVTVASIGILLGGRAAIGFASGASLIVLMEQSYRVLWLTGDQYFYVQTGLLGAAFFISAVLASALARQLKESEVLAAQRGVDLVNLGQLNEYIIQRMGSGVLVVDRNAQIRLMNEAAWYLLGMPVKSGRQLVQDLSKELHSQLESWLNDDQCKPTSFRVTGSMAIYPRFTRLGMQDYAGTLIILEDTSLLEQQAQDLKLTALGRLTASIAHEIRNPLGAISHASQLLEESSNLDKADRRLTQIIREQSVRMNAIIENVMQLSRRDKAKPEIIVLKPWIQDFVMEFCRGHDLSVDQIEVDITPDNVKVFVDPSHLHQILSNLCQNAIRHGLDDDASQVLVLRGGETRELRGPFLDVIDYGGGIAPEMVGQIFEPFFTTASKGTGLGLYIARELAEANQAHLDYIPIPAGGSCFRIAFVQNNRRNR